MCIHVQPRRPARKRARSALAVRRGFTLVELLLGLAITAMVTLAAAGIMVSTAQGWQSGEDTQALDTTARQADRTIQRLLGSCRYIGEVVDTADGGSRILFWREDTNRDGLAQFSEVSLIEYDAAARTISLANLPSTAGHAQDVSHGDELRRARAASMFASLSGLQRFTLAAEVLAADFTFRAGGTAQRDGVEFTFRTAAGTASGCQYGFAVPRGMQVPG